MQTTIGINGVCGRMGMRILQLAQEDADLQVGSVGFTAKSSYRQGPEWSPDWGRTGSPSVLEIDLSSRVDALIDCSRRHHGGAANLYRPTNSLIVATTGHTPAQRQEIEAVHQTAC